MNLFADINPVVWQREFQSAGRVHIPGVLASASARELFSGLEQQAQWNLVFRRDGKHTEINADSVNAWSLKQRSTFDEIVYSQATSDFQYLYQTVPIYDLYHEGALEGHFFKQLFEFLNSDEFLNFVRVVVGRPEIAFTDAQATCYRAGHFLAEHDDDIQDKHRAAAYVLNMTPEWHINWGGALQFTRSDGHVAEAYLPRYNALNIFAVPQRHAVTMVAPFARKPRLSITGWLRTGTDPGCQSQT